MPAKDSTMHDFARGLESVGRVGSTSLNVTGQGIIRLLENTAGSIFWLSLEKHNFVSYVPVWHSLRNENDLQPVKWAKECRSGQRRGLNSCDALGQ